MMGDKPDTFWRIVEMAVYILMGICAVLLLLLLFTDFCMKRGLPLPW